jgi:hypothetical protein
LRVNSGDDLLAGGDRCEEGEIAAKVCVEGRYSVSPEVLLEDLPEDAGRAEEALNLEFLSHGPVEPSPLYELEEVFRDFAEASHNDG